MNKMYQESETVHNEISIKEEIKEEKEDFESCSNENNFEKEKLIVAESECNEKTCDEQKVVPLQFHRQMQKMIWFLSQFPETQRKSKVCHSPLL